MCIRGNHFFHNLVPTKWAELTVPIRILRFSRSSLDLQVFFTIRLIPMAEAATLGEIKDPDPLMASEMMDGRDTFLTKARDEHWEFSSMRRAKVSRGCSGER